MVNGRDFATQNLGSLLGTVKDLEQRWNASRIRCALASMPPISEQQFRRVR
jgi:hypothetical protein